MTGHQRRMGLRTLWLLVVIGLAVWLTATRHDALYDLVSELRPGPLALLVAASCLLLVPNAAFWTLSLRAMGQSPRYGVVLHASARALLARYLPGGIWYAAGRGALLRHHGISAPASATTGGLELALGAPVAVVVGTVLLAAAGEAPAWMAVAAVLALVAVVGLGGATIGRLVAYLARRRGGEAAAVPGVSTLVRLTAVLVGYWLAIGTLFWAYLEVVGSTTIAWLDTVGAFGVSWGAGFIALFAPQGLGVFEGTLVAVMDWGAEAVLLVAGFRAVLLVRDLLLTVAAEVVARRGRSGS